MNKPLRDWKTMISYTIKTCPFCGGHGVLIKVDSKYTPHHYYCQCAADQCPGHSEHQFWSTPADAIAVWNRRIHWYHLFWKWLTGRSIW